MNKGQIHVYVSISLVLLNVSANDLVYTFCRNIDPRDLWAMALVNFRIGPSATFINMQLGLGPGLSHVVGQDLDPMLWGMVSGVGYGQGCKQTRRKCVMT